MNDDFLHEFRESPRPEFTEALYKQLTEEADDAMLPPKVLMLSPNGQVTSRPRPHAKNRSLPLIAAVFALLILGSLILYTANSGGPHLIHLTQIDTEIVLDDLPQITRENANRLAEIKQIGNGAVYQIAWSPDGKTLAAAGTLGVWLYDTSAWDAPPLLLAMSPDIGLERAVTFSPDGTLLAASDGVDIRVWRTDTWEPALTLQGHTSTVIALAFSPDSTILASGGGDYGVENGDYAVRLWDVQSGTDKTQITLSDGVVRSLAFSPDGNLLAGTCWCDGYTEWVVNIRTGQENSYLAHNSNTNHYPGMVFSPDGILLAEATQQGVNLWDVTDGQPVTEAKRTGSNPLSIQSMAFSPDGKLLAFGGRDNGINLWDTETQAFLPRSSQQSTLINVESLTFNPDGTQIATLTNNNFIQIWDTYSGDELAAIQGWNGAVRALLSADGETIIGYPIQGGLISVFNSDDGTLRLRIDTGLNDIFYRGIAISPDNTTLAYGGWNAEVLNASPILTGAEISLTNLLTGETRSLGEESKQNYIIAVSPDGTHLASTSSNDFQIVHIWDLTDPEIPATGIYINAEFNPPDIYLPNTVKYTPDGQYLVIETTNNYIAVVHPETGETQWVFVPPGVIDPNNNRFYTVLSTISPDGSRLIAIYSGLDEDPANESMMVTWSLETGEVLSILPMDYRIFADPIFSPDGSLLVVLGTDQMRFLDAESGNTLYQTDTLGSSISSIAFDASGRFIVTGGWDGLIWIWGVLPG